MDVHQAPRVIDLGEDFTPVETPEEIRQRGQRGRRFATIAGLVMLTLLTVASAAAATPALRQAATLPVTPQSVAMLVGSRVLVAGIYDHTNKLNAYDVRSGELIWSTRLSVLTHGSSLARSGDVAVVTYSSDTVSGDKTNAVDINTGRILWGSPAWVLDVRGGNLLMVEPAGAAPLQLSAVDPVTGARFWTQTVGSNCRDDVGAVYVQVCDNGVMRVVNVTDGTLRARTHLDLGGFVQSRNEYQNPPELAQDRNVVAVGHFTRGDPTLDGFDATTLRPLWSRSFDPSADLVTCGDLFCMFGERVAVGIDPLTGASRPFPGYQAITYDQGISRQNPASANPLDYMYALVPFRLTPDRKGIYAGATDVPVAPDSEPVLVPEPGIVSAYLAILEPATGRLRIIDHLDGVGAASCTAMGSYLACEKAHGILQFWVLK